ncbi:hypothetical protein EVAR_30781_1 [Eumeta japonica]|uniref:Uncharacterized protein n=1 Tax=Eumeta variegata TaxID=151549 RepID=A0A4C1V7D8_EUMVA|nr:hypothetical protein EVAR_30781_1 [Eumeta japonica]
MITFRNQPLTSVGDRGTHDTRTDAHPPARRAADWRRPSAALALTQRKTHKYNVNSYTNTVACEARLEGCTRGHRPVRNTGGLVVGSVALELEGARSDLDHGQIDRWLFDLSERRLLATRGSDSRSIRGRVDAGLWRPPDPRWGALEI